jgi:hypothetical protein
LHLVTVSVDIVGAGVGLRHCAYSVSDVFSLAGMVPPGLYDVPVPLAAVFQPRNVLLECVGRVEGIVADESWLL